MVAQLVLNMPVDGIRSTTAGLVLEVGDVGDFLQTPGDSDPFLFDTNCVSDFRKTRELRKPSSPVSFRNVGPPIEFTGFSSSSTILFNAKLAKSGAGIKNS